MPVGFLLFYSVFNILRGYSPIYLKLCSFEHTIRFGYISLINRVVKLLDECAYHKEIKKLGSTALCQSRRMYIPSSTEFSTLRSYSLLEEAETRIVLIPVMIGRHFSMGMEGS